MVLGSSVFVTLDSGQAFRWQLQDGIYRGIAGGRFFEINASQPLELSKGDFLYDYFNCSTDWQSIKDEISALSPYVSVAVGMFPGLRILRQEPFETLISFIISSCNNIPRIKKIIECLCSRYGEPLSAGHFAFPSVKTLSTLRLADFSACGMGFRDRYVMDAVRRVASGDIDLDAPYALDTDSARRLLMKIDGVGRKVADCILLFAYNKFDAFPKDVWIKRVMSGALAGTVEENLGRYRGIVQQFLFMRIRDESNGR